MITVTTPKTLTPAATGPQSRLSQEELAMHAQRLGIAAELIQVRDLNAPDCVTVVIGKPDGRSLRKVVPRTSWNEPAYRRSLLQDMGLMLA